jgi:hypothetical protein
MCARKRAASSRLRKITEFWAGNASRKGPLTFSEESALLAAWMNSNG